MKFLVDECIGRSVFLWLKNNFDAIYVQDVMPAATDLYSFKLKSPISRSYPSTRDHPVDRSIGANGAKQKSRFSFQMSIEILDVSLAEDRIIVTRDKDFGDMIFRDKKQHVGIVLLRLVSKHPSYQLIVLQEVLNMHHNGLIGNFIVASESSVKIIKGICH